MAELNVQQKNIVNQLRQAYPELKSYSDEQILSLYNQQLNNVQLTEAEKISIMNGKNGVVNDGMGIQLETSQKAVSKEQEAQLKSALTARLNAVSTNVKKAEDSNGFLGSMWSGFKNLTGIGDSSDKVREQQKADLKALQGGNIAEAFKQITGLDYTVENVNKFLNNEVQTKSETALNGYTEGQEMASDITADIVSGIAAVGIYTAAVAAAPFTGGASIAVGVVAAGASAAAIKTGIKYADAKSGGREYTADNLKKDLATGAFSGVLAPITGGMGGAVGKTVATKVGIQAVKQVGKEVAEEAVEQTAKGFVKTMLTNPTGYEYIGGNMVKRGLAFAAEAATDGAIGGAVDNAFRTAYDGGSLEDIGNSAVEGFVGGAIMSPVIGGGMKVAGKGAQKIFGKNNVDIDANGNRVRVNDDGTVVRIDENGNEIPASATVARIHLTNSTSSLVDEFNSFKTRLKEEGENFTPQFDNPNSPIAKYYNSLLESLNKQIKFYEDTISQGKKYFGKKPTTIAEPNLHHFQSFLLLNSHELNISKDEYWQVVKELNKEVVKEIKNNPFNFRKEIIDNAEKIQEWASIFATQNSKTGNSKFFDEEMFNQAVKEYSEFIEKMTGKKLLIGCTSRMNFPISAIGLLNDAFAYKDVDYILLGHGKGSSLITDITDPNTWRFSDNDLSIYEYIEQNVPKGKKVLVFSCEVEGLKLANKTREEMIDRAGNRMLGIGSQVSGEFEESGSAKIVKSGIRHIIGQVYSKGKTITQLGNTTVLDHNAGHIVIANQVEKLYYDLDFEPYKVENLLTSRELTTIDNIVSKYSSVREQAIVKQLLTKETIPIVERFVGQDTSTKNVLRFLDVIRRREYTMADLEKLISEGQIIDEKLLHTLEFKNFEKVKDITLDNFSELSLKEKIDFINAFVSINFRDGNKRYVDSLPDMAIFSDLKSKKAPQRTGTSKEAQNLFNQQNADYIAENSRTFNAILNSLLEQIPRGQNAIPKSAIALTPTSALAIKPSITSKVSSIPTSTIDVGSHKVRVGVLADDGNYYVHSLYEEQLPRLEGYLLTDPDAILCTGLLGINGNLKAGDARPSIIVSPKTSVEDILITAKEDVSSGYGATKNLFNIRSMFLTADNEHNNYLPNLIKSKLKLTAEEYNLRMEKVKNITHIDDIESVDKELYDAIKAVLNENPIYESIMRPNIEAVYLPKGMEISEEIASFAERYDIPILFKEIADLPITPKVDFETKFPILKEQNLIVFIEEEFRKKYPDRDISEFYSLTAFNYANFSNNLGQNKAFLRSFIDSMDNLKEFPYEKYEKYLSGSSPLIIASLKFNDGITPEILDKYVHLLTPKNFSIVVKNLTKENIAILNKYIAEGKITPENIAKITKFNIKFDSMLTEYFGEKIDNELFEELIKLDIKDLHYNYIETFKNFVDKDNIVRILSLGQFDLPKEKLNIPEELIGTIITKENFIDISRKLNNLLDLKLEKLADFKDINWDKYRNYVIAHAKDGVTSDILELMRQGVEPRILNILRASWPATDHGGEEADFAKYIINMSKIKEWDLVDKLELYEQCSQPLMIEHAKKDPFVENLFKEFKSRLEAELLHPVNIIETPRIAKDNFMQLISNNPIKAKKLEKMDIQEIKNLIYAEFPELKTLTQDNSFAQLLQDIAKSSEFKNLDDKSKFNIKLAAILSTVKPEYANALMEKLNLQYSTRRDVLDLLGSTKYFSLKGSYNINTTHVLATLFPTENKLNAAKLFAKIKDNFILSEESETMIRMAQDSSRRKGVPVFSTRLPKGQNLEKIPTVSYNGKEYQVLNLLEEYDDLSAFGFVPGTTLDNFSVNATFVRDVNEANTMFLSGNPIISGIPSTSKIGLGQNASFQERTFAILVEDVDKTDYIFANKQDTDIGHGVKNIYVASQKIFNTFNFEDGFKHRVYMADLLKERLGLTQEQYSELYSQIIDKKYISQIKSLKIDGKEVSSQRLAEIKTALEEAQKDLVSTDFYKGNHNETNLSRPEVNQDFILAKVNDISEIPQEWLDYAERNNKKFILIGNSQENGGRFARSVDIRKTQVYNDIIPEIKYSDSDLQAIQEKINTFIRVCKKEEVSLNIDGVEVKATRFLNTQQGSNQAYYTQIGDKLYYIKYCGNDNGQCIEEVIASKLYRLAGIDAPNTKYVYDENDKIIGMASEYIPNISMKPKHTADVFDGYAVDAWLANWDAPKNDNTQFRASGVVKIDVGGSLRHRARGGIKEFGLEVPELSSLLENNPQYLTMTKEDLLNSLEHIINIPESGILKIIAESPLTEMQLADILIERQNYIKIFKQNLEKLDEKQFNSILELVKKAEAMTLN